MKRSKNVLTLISLIFFLSIFSISLSSPLDDYTENLKNDNSNIALYTPINPKDYRDNTLFVIHIDIGNKERLDSYQYENNTVLRGLERSINSYVNILNNIRSRKHSIFNRR